MEYIKNYDENLYKHIKDLHFQKKQEQKKLFSKLLTKLKKSIDFTKPRKTIFPNEDIIRNILISACTFMKINLEDQNKIAKQYLAYIQHAERYETQEEADDFWINDTNIEWLCLNLMVQTQWYNDIFSSLVHLKEIKNVQSVYDYGCGTGAFSILLDSVFHFKKLVLSDLDNYPSSFIRYYIESEGKNHIHWENILESDGEKYDMIVCLDVLEHIEDSYEHLMKLDSKLNKGGVFALKIAFESEDKTHLPKAAKNFFIENDGYGFLTRNYKLIKDFFYHEQLINGIYIKR